MPFYFVTKKLGGEKGEVSHTDGDRGPRTARSRFTEAAPLASGVRRTSPAQGSFRSTGPAQLPTPRSAIDALHRVHVIQLVGVAMAAWDESELNRQIGSSEVRPYLSVE
jgi:hypothetical protein